MNKWNGDLLVDAAGNKILTAMVGAGHKEENNTFTGVVMGDVEHQDPYDGNRLKKSTGLFGYKEGGQTFGFDTEGTAFLGKSGNGRIYVDGNTGRITSAAREAYDINIASNVNDTDPRGTEINLKENYIDLQGIGNKSRIHIDAEPRSERDGGTRAYFSIDDIEGNRLLHIGEDSDGNNSYYLQTSSRAKGQPGLLIDLEKGTFDSTGSLTILGDSNSRITFGKTFNVDGNGEVTLGSLTFVDTNGNVMTETTIDKNGRTVKRAATGIHPK